jgi:hypothetical protein
MKSIRYILPALLATAAVSAAAETSPSTTALVENHPGLTYREAVWRGSFF